MADTTETVEPVVTYGAAIWEDDETRDPLRSVAPLGTVPQF